MDIDILEERLAKKTKPDARCPWPDAAKMHWQRAEAYVFLPHRHTVQEGSVG
jgi:hypothetical protein